MQGGKKIILRKISVLLFIPHFELMLDISGKITGEERKFSFFIPPLWKYKIPETTKTRLENK